MPKKLKWQKRPVSLIKSTLISPLSENQLQPTTLGCCAPCEVTYHKYFLFLMDVGRLLLFVIVIVLFVASEEEDGGTWAWRCWQRWWWWSMKMIMMFSAGGNFILVLRALRSPRRKKFRIQPRLLAALLDELCRPFLYFRCGCWFFYCIVVFYVSPLSSGTDGFVPLSLEATLIQELSFSRDNNISVKCAARLVLVLRALVIVKRALGPWCLCCDGVWLVHNGAPIR